jgi:hypothetical protein
MAEPIPLFPSFSYDLYRGKNARSTWSGYQVPGDGDDPAVRLAFDDSDADAIVGLPARPDDPPGPRGRVWRFATYLHRTIDTSSAASGAVASRSAVRTDGGGTPDGDP